MKRLGVDRKSEWTTGCISSRVYSQLEDAASLITMKAAARFQMVGPFDRPLHQLPVLSLARPLEVDFPICTSYQPLHPPKGWQVGSRTDAHMVATMTAPRATTCGRYAGTGLLAAGSPVDVLLDY